jgi:hypothetical protein
MVERIQVTKEDIQRVIDLAVQLRPVLVNFNPSARDVLSACLFISATESARAGYSLEEYVIQSAKWATLAFEKIQ